MRKRLEAKDLGGKDLVGKRPRGEVTEWKRPRAKDGKEKTEGKVPVTVFILICLKPSSLRYSLRTLC